MPQSLVMIVAHLVFSTKNRSPVLFPQVRPALYAYMSGILHQQTCRAIIIDGVEDHVHILCSLSKTLAPCKVVEEVKTGSSKWLKLQDPVLRDFHWQNGYGMFSVGPSDMDATQEYVRNQEAHHAMVTFQDEYRRFLTKNGVPFDERYVWD